MGFVDELKTKGFSKYGTKDVFYSISPQFTEMYLPAAPEIMDLLWGGKKLVTLLALSKIFECIPYARNKHLI